MKIKLQKIKETNNTIGWQHKQYEIYRGTASWNLYDNFPKGYIDSYDTLTDVRGAITELEASDNN